MNREQGYKLIELVFIANEKFVMHRCRFSFIALDKSVISYLGISTSKKWRLFIAFLKSDHLVKPVTQRGIMPRQDMKQFMTDQLRQFLL